MDEMHSLFRQDVKKSFLIQCNVLTLQLTDEILFSHAKQVPASIPPRYSEVNLSVDGTCTAFRRVDGFPLLCYFADSAAIALISTQPTDVIIMIETDKPVYKPGQTGWRL